MATENPQFLTCVGSLPVVTSAWSQVSDMYTKTKEHNSLLNYTLGLAESSVKKVVTTAQPLAEKYEGPIKYVNDVACNQLTHLKEKYPVIAKPTDEVLQDGKALIQPAVDRINAVKDFGVSAYTKSTETLSRVTNYGHGVVNQALQTSYGQVVNNQVINALDLSEVYLDKYLPPADTDVKEPVENSDNALVRAGHVSSKLRRRMYSRVNKNLHNAKVRSTEALAKLHYTVDLIQYAKSNLDGAKTQVEERVGAVNTKFWDTWNEINREEKEGESEKGELETQSLEKRGIAIARHLLNQVKSNVNSLETTIVQLPGTLQDIHIKQYGNEVWKYIQSYTEEVRKSLNAVGGVNEVPTWMINQAKNQLTYVQEMFGFLTEQAINTLPLGWMEMDVNLEGLNLEEIEHMWTHNGNIVSINGRIRSNEQVQ